VRFPTGLQEALQQGGLSQQAKEQMFAFDVGASIIAALISREENCTSGFLVVSVKHIERVGSTARLGASYAEGKSAQLI
jgi:hypothetical protein